MGEENHLITVPQNNYVQVQVQIFYKVWNIKNFMYLCLQLDTAVRGKQWSDT